VRKLPQIQLSWQHNYLTRLFKRD